VAETEDTLFDLTPGIHQLEWSIIAALGNPESVIQLILFLLDHRFVHQREIWEW
jgi:hypothetical protein